jgi:hypothetical protein
VLIVLVCAAFFPAYASPYDVGIDVPSWALREPAPVLDVRSYDIMDGGHLLAGEGVIDLHAAPAVAPAAPTVAPTVRTHEDRAAVAVEAHARES